MQYEDAISELTALKLTMRDAPTEAAREIAKREHRSAFQKLSHLNINYARRYARESA